MRASSVICARELSLSNGGAGWLMRLEWLVYSGARWDRRLPGFEILFHGNNLRTLSEDADRLLLRELRRFHESPEQNDRSV